MNFMFDLRCDPEDAEGLRAEIVRRDKIIRALIRQVEHGLSVGETDYALLQNNFVLEEQVRLRTEELKKSVDALESFMANASLGIVFTRDGSLLRHNRKFGEMFGIPGDAGIGSSARMLFRSDAEFERLALAARELLRSGETFHSELYLRRLDGTDVWVNLIGYVGNLQETGSGTVVWLVEDRTAAKAADEALRQSRDELEARVSERTAQLSQQLHFQRQLIEAIPSPVFYKDNQARYLGCNRAYEAFVGCSENELVGKTALDIAPRELAEKCHVSDAELLAHPGSQIYETRVRNRNGEIRDVIFHKASFHRADGSVAGLVGVVIDISERKRMEEHLRQAATVFESSAEGVTVTRPDGTIIAVNRAFTEISGYSADEVVGQNPRMLQSGRHGREFYRQLWDSIICDGCWQGEVWNRRKNGEVYPEWLSIRTVRDEHGEVSNYVATFSDISQQKQNEERIHQLAFSDPLTNLPNRRLLLERLQHALATRSRNRQFGALFFIDLDHFKDLNDTRGHDMGDLLLQKVAERLAASVREGDTVARFGGDEFVVMLEDLSDRTSDAVSEVKAAGDKIMARLNEPYPLNEYLHHCTPSIGVTLFGHGDTSVDQLLKQADLAMYQAKASGRNALRFYDPEMQEEVSARVALEADLRHGIQARQFVLHFQPQMDQAGCVQGAEALVRWLHPVRGMVSPLEFIPLAEDTELILPLGAWVLDSACEQLSRWARQPELAHLTLSVNVSARQFRQADFVSLVLNTLNRTGADPRRLKLEITESMLLDNIDEIVAKMAALKAHGVSFSLDDFGTGYSSLSYIKRLPFDQLKIDQSFVRDVLADANDAAIARTVVTLAQAMGLDVVAEGVEKVDQLAFLAEIGCHSYQGFLFGRPMEIADFEALAGQA